MTKAARLLCISNGHGEDAIALRILSELRSRQPQIELAVLPLVGEGTAFQKQQIPLIAATKTLPSGGFIYMDSRQLARDVRGGLAQLTLAQLQALKRWAQDGGAVLAVGDVIPAAFAWWSGLPYGIVGTAKSAYYLRDEQGLLADLPWYAGWAGLSMYLPWERWLMSRDRCRAVIVRDELTCSELQRSGLPEPFAGNPMMDGLALTQQSVILKPQESETLTVVLLPGSRAPEAYANWQILLQGMDSVLNQWAPHSVQFLGAIAPALDIAELQRALEQAGWYCEAPDSDYFVKENGRVLLTQTAYADCLHLADTAIAMAGTATEQFVGLGKPAFITPGAGPQFTPTFAKLQTRLLGPSVILVNRAADLGTAMATVLADSDRLAQIRQNGRQRMGSPGAAAAIAQHLSQTLLPHD
ncbi:MAG: lipid-A-disaccharide synthase-related protein [Cyanobacteria bacterium P01_C01_bin.120]